MDGDESTSALWPAHTPAGDEEAAYKPDADGGDGHLRRLLAASQRHPHHVRLLREGRPNIGWRRATSPYCRTVSVHPSVHLMQTFLK